MRDALGEARLRGLSERDRRACSLLPVRLLLRRDEPELDDDDELERDPDEPVLDVDDERERERELERELLVLPDSLLKFNNGDFKFKLGLYKYYFTMGFLLTYPELELLDSFGIVDLRFFGLF